MTEPTTDNLDHNALLRDEIRREALLRTLGMAPGAAPELPVLNAPFPGQKVTNRIVPAEHQAPQGGVSHAQPEPGPARLIAPAAIPLKMASLGTTRQPTAAPKTTQAEPAAVPAVVPSPDPALAKLGESLKSSASPSPMRGLLTLQLLQQMFPNHAFTPVDYNPYAVLPKGGATT